MFVFSRSHQAAAPARATRNARRLVLASVGASALLMVPGAPAQAEPAPNAYTPGCSAWNAKIPALPYRVCVVTRAAPGGTWARSVVRVLNATDVVRGVHTTASMVVSGRGVPPLVCGRQVAPPRLIVSCSSKESFVPGTGASVYARAYGTVRDEVSGLQGTGSSPSYRPGAPAPPLPVPPVGPGNGGFPPDVTTAPERAHYDDAPSWNDGKNCTGTFTVGSKRLQDWIRANWGPAEIGGYACRRNTASRSKTSIHGVGRASDWSRSVNNPAQAASVQRFIERMTANGAAMARAMGVQYWIWNKKQYSVKDSSVKVSTYNGPNPHTDHVHIEQNLAGSNLQTSYWILAGR